MGLGRARNQEVAGRLYEVLISNQSGYYALMIYWV